MMLDPKATFDALVVRHAADPAQAERILANGFYRTISSALGGTQEYMAMEKLHELHEDGDFDLIVVDTPPSRHALDFLDAPDRLLRLLDNRIFRALIAPARTGLRLAGVAQHGAAVLLRLHARTHALEARPIEDERRILELRVGLDWHARLDRGGRESHGHAAGRLVRAGLPGNAEHTASAG